MNMNVGGVGGNSALFGANAGTSVSPTQALFSGFFAKGRPSVVSAGVVKAADVPKQVEFDTRSAH